MHNFLTNHKRQNSGMGLMEIIIGTTIISLSLVGLIAAFNLFIKAGLSNTEKIKAVYLLEEGMEAFRYIRDSGWDLNISTLSTGVPYYLVFDGAEWEATTTVTVIDSMYHRTVSVDDVYRRDTDSDIVATTSPDTKTLDPNTKQTTIMVTWDGGTVQAATYFVNIFDN